MGTTLDRNEIEAILPHRPPFLFVDRISEIVPGERIVGEFRIRETETFLFRSDGQAYLPATLLTESMAQVGAILVLHPDENRGRTIFFRAIEETEFHRLVPSGAKVLVEARVKKLRARFGSLTVEARVDGELAAKGVMSFALG
jgi:3-hydroxyacyl-[acyl-carrier-protein] dehydratase